MAVLKGNEKRRLLWPTLLVLVLMLVYKLSTRPEHIPVWWIILGSFFQAAVFAVVMYWGFHWLIKWSQGHKN